MINSFYKNMEFSKDDDLYFLKMFKNYSSNETKGIKLKYELNSPGLVKIKERWNLTSIMGTGSDIEKILRLKKWAYDLLCFKGNPLCSRRYDSLDCFDIIDTAKKEGYSLNCRYISLIFTQILLSVGYKARWVSCLPMELNYNECHCVTEVYVEEYRKWIVIDLALGLLYFNKKGEVLNLQEIRQCVLNNTPFRIQIKEHWQYQYVWDYWIRHVFRFKFILENKFNMLAAPNKTFIYLNPEKFKVKDKRIPIADNDTTKICNIYDDSIFWESEEKC